MHKIVESAAEMPQSSMWWPIMLGGLWCLIMLWPRHDGGGIPYVIGAVAPAWFTLGPLVLVWLAWALAVMVFG
jgi:hypothetical protein